MCIRDSQMGVPGSRSSTLSSRSARSREASPEPAFCWSASITTPSDRCSAGHACGSTVTTRMSRDPCSAVVRAVAVAAGTTSRIATQSGSPGSPSNGRRTNSALAMVSETTGLGRCHPMRAPRCARGSRWEDQPMHPRAGTVALPEDLVDLDALTSAYYDRAPDLDDPGQQVVFGTSGHRGSSLDGAFNEAHIVAITAAIVEYRRSRGTDGPLFIGRDTHALSLPAWQTALEVLAAAGVDVHIDARDGYTPTPAVSHAILLHNGAATSEGVHLDGASSARTGLADGIVVTPSHNPPRDGGFKYNPPHGGPADSEVTGWIATRANELLRSGVGNIRRLGREAALTAPTTRRHDFMSAYVDDLATVLDLDLIRACLLYTSPSPRDRTRS